jgi:hypothetical protein
MKKLMPLMILSIVILFGCAKEETNELAQAIDTGIAQDYDDTEVGLRGNNPKPRPISGSIDYLGGADIDLTCDCPDGTVIGNYFLGTGNITHLGNSTSESIPCIELIISEGNVIGYNIPSQCTIFTAANGDELQVVAESYTMMLDFNCFCRFASTEDVTTTYEGGTGRFANASGSSSGPVVQDLTVDPSVTTINFEGEIIY